MPLDLVLVGGRITEVPGLIVPDFGVTNFVFPRIWSLRRLIVTYKWREFLLGFRRWRRGVGGGGFALLCR